MNDKQFASKYNTTEWVASRITKVPRLVFSKVVSQDFNIKTQEVIDFELENPEGFVKWLGGHSSYGFYCYARETEEQFNKRIIEEIKDWEVAFIIINETRDVYKDCIPEISGLQEWIDENIKRKDKNLSLQEVWVDGKLVGINKL